MSFARPETQDRSSALDAGRSERELHWHPENILKILAFELPDTMWRGTSFYRGTTVRPVRAVAPVPRQTYSFQVFARFTRLELGPDTSALQTNADIIMFV